jgi:[glutamine synthetase] adenylyltransferase / [glutamine synthetase]-adenylyl-L-tyrosine phosphorylase
VTREMAKRYGTVPGGRIVVVALGKFGGREMTALSDLDLMVIYDIKGAASESTGGKPIYASEWHARLTQRLVTALTAPTQRGTLYEVDLRLRPSGGKGPVAGTLDAFAAYHATDSETWERMALTRARIVAGDPVFGREVMTAIATAACRPTAQDRLRRDIKEMRALVAKEKPAKGRFDLKLTPGGLVDIEFAAQFLQLSHGSAYPQVLCANTGAAIRQLMAARLLAPAAGESLLEAWRLQSALAQLFALAGLTWFEPASAREAFKKRMAAVAGLPDFRTLEGALKDSQTRAHGVMRDLL